KSEVSAAGERASGPRTRHHLPRRLSRRADPIAEAVGALTSINPGHDRVCVKCGAWLSACRRLYWRRILIPENYRVLAAQRRAKARRQAKRADPTIKTENGW